MPGIAINHDAPGTTLLWRIAPGVRALGEYRRAWLGADAVAGATLAAYLLPAALGDATLANLPPEAGLYACLFSGLVFWIFCSSQRTVITVTSAISLLVGASLGDLAGGDGGKFRSLAACTALLVAAMAFVIWLINAGVVINFISETVLAGFKCGIAFVLAGTQLPKLFGFKGVHGSFWQNMFWFFGHLHEANVIAVTLGLTALAVLLLGKLFLKNKPVALVVVVVGIVLASTMNLAGYGVKMLGDIPQGMPSLGLPAVSLADVNELFPLALACLLLSAVETAAIGRMFAVKYRYRFDPNQEFLALAVSSAAAGFGRGLPVSGGMSQSLVNEEGGARTPLSGLAAAGLILIVVVFFSHLLRDLPQPILAAVVLTAVIGLVQIDTLKHIWHFDRSEFAIAMIVLLGVLEFGILHGVLIGALLSILLLLRRASRLHATELARVPGTNLFGDMIRHAENQREAQVFIFRVEGAIVYFNADYVRDRFFELLGERTDEIRLAVFYLGTVSGLDLAGVELLIEMQRTLQDRNIELRLADAHGQVREALRRGGFDKRAGPIHANQTVESVLGDWKASDGGVLQIVHG